MEHTPTFGAVRRSTGQDARCSKYKKGQAEIRPCGYGGHGFLKHRFELLRGAETLPYSREGEDFLLSSFRNLAALYGYNPVDVSDKVFPLNISLLYKEAATILERRDRRLELLLLEDNGRMHLTTAREASTGR